jgi:hypothetical protein
MKAVLSKKFVIAATGLVMLGGAAGAVAATQSSSSPSAQAQAYLNDLAGRLGVTPTALSAAVKAADSDQIDAALAAGRLTQAEASALKARIQASAGVPLLGRGLGLGASRFGGGFGDLYSEAATYLGVSESTLRADLQAGQSLAAIASATPDRSVDGLKTAIVNAETTQLNTAASDDRITNQQETQRLADLSSRIDALLQRTGTAGRGGSGAGAWARGGRSGTPRGSTGASGPNLFGSSSAAA